MALSPQTCSATPTFSARWLPELPSLPFSSTAWPSSTSRPKSTTVSSGGGSLFITCCTSLSLSHSAGTPNSTLSGSFLRDLSTFQLRSSSLTTRPTASHDAGVHSGSRESGGPGNSLPRAACATPREPSLVHTTVGTPITGAAAGPRSRGLWRACWRSRPRTPRRAGPWRRPAATPTCRRWRGRRAPSAQCPTTPVERGGSASPSAVAPMREARTASALPPRSPIAAAARRRSSSPGTRTTSTLRGARLLAGLRPRDRRAGGLQRFCGETARVRRRRARRVVPRSIPMYRCSPRSHATQVGASCRLAVDKGRREHLRARDGILLRDAADDRVFRDGDGGLRLALQRRDRGLARLALRLRHHRLEHRRLALHRARCSTSGRFRSHCSCAPTHCAWDRACACAEDLHARTLHLVGEARQVVVDGTVVNVGVGSFGVGRFGVGRGRRLGLAPGSGSGSRAAFASAAGRRRGLGSGASAA